jgi:hypothetical protein
LTVALSLRCSRVGASPAIILVKRWPTAGRRSEGANAMTERRYRERAVQDEDTEGNRKMPLTTDDDEDTEGNKRSG